MEHRPLYQSIWNELSAQKAMIFMAGPRQAGKTTLARQVAGQHKNSLFFNWDIPADKKKLIQNPSFFEDLNRVDDSTPLIILDEIHKYRSWKNYLKGTYDQFHEDYKFLILGSGRLDIFQKGGDSLAGRYFLFHLWPFTLAELGGKNADFKTFVNSPLSIKPDDASLKSTWDQLARLSGFPEPFLSGQDAFYQRWSQTYAQQLIREDIRDMTGIKHIDTVEILFSLLSSKVGSPLSMTSLAEDIQASFTSIRDWLEIFERFYLIFRISPWAKRISRAISKEKKLYLFDYAQVEDPAKRFENMVALELFRAVHAWNDLGLGKFGLFYIRNKEKQEVDFLITSKNTPFLLIETKLNDDAPNPPLLKFQTILNVPAVQLINKDNTCKILTNGPQKLLITSAPRWLATLP